MNNKNSQFNKIANFFKEEYIKMKKKNKIKEKNSESLKIYFIFIKSSYILTFLGVL